MDKFRKNIVVLEPSKIIYEGLYASISQADYDYAFFHLHTLNEIKELLSIREISVVLINPSVVQNKVSEFIRIKKQYNDIHWVGIIYCFFDDSALKLFDATFQITEDITVIIRKINKICNHQSLDSIHDERLSKRETVVLKWLSRGLSNKEIAEKLNVSIHTINTHRRNIMDKTGIRSLAGLTVYAVSKGIISLE
ncbi:MAG: helix-turn-helix transcriptional regulator [Bacteroidales bacterium]|nr:helix-turn-helix transcriptional regulator [Bacteroidales bacterium]MDD4713133.1 helix-turn-helix transcriptional regulator [Bacteroidales bacterium]